MHTAYYLPPFFEVMLTLAMILWTQWSMVTVGIVRKYCQLSASDRMNMMLTSFFPYFFACLGLVLCLLPTLCLVSPGLQMNLLVIRKTAFTAKQMKAQIEAG